MKTIEEKAKAYDEALERAKSFFRRWENVEEANSFLVLKEVKDIFPELKESEDERIRKTLIEIFSNAGRNDWKGIPNEKVIAWLEKQGSKPQGKTALEAVNEEKVDNANKVVDFKAKDWYVSKGDGKIHNIYHSDKDKSKFNVGDWIIHQGTGNVYQVTACIDNQYQLKYGDAYTIQKCDDVDRHARLLDAAKDLR